MSETATEHSGAKPRSPGRPRKLSRSAVIDAAIELVDAQGPELLSMRTLAKYLGVNHATLYNYFAGAEDIQVAAVERLFAEIPPLPPRSAGAATFREQLAKNLLALRDIQQQHPMALHAPIGSATWKNNFARMNAAMRSVREFCDSDEEAWYALDLLLAAVSASAESERLNRQAPLREQQRRALATMPAEDKDMLTNIIEKYSVEAESQRFLRRIDHAIRHLIPALDG